MNPWVASLAFALSVAAVTSGCGSFDRKTLSIALPQGVWTDALEEVASRFSAKNGVEVRIVDLPYDDLYSAEVGDLERDHQYDVIVLDDPWFPALFKDAAGQPRLRPLTWERWCEDLKDFPEPLRQVITDPQATPNGVVSDCATPPVYAVPFVGNTQMFFVRDNTKGLDTWTADESPRSAVEVRPIDGYVMRAGPGNSIVTDFMPMLWGADPHSFRSAESLTLSPRANAAFAFVKAVGMSPRANQAVVSLDDTDLGVRLARGQGSMAIVWSAWVMAMDRLPVRLGRFSDDFEFAEMPGGNHALGAWLLAVPTAIGDRRAKLATEFAAFATSGQQLEMAALAGNPPPRRSVLQVLMAKAKPRRSSSRAGAALDSREPPYSREFLEHQLKQLETAIPRPRTRRWREVEKALGGSLTALYEGSASDLNQVRCEADAQIRKIAADDAKRTDAGSSEGCQSPPRAR
jgi:ABC-type glycerol-3-phosphate transport system substrate-binding protein